MITKTHLVQIFDTSHPFRNETLKEKLRYYKAESIENPYQTVLATNRKKCHKQLENLKTNKKRKGAKQGSAGMEFETFASRICSLNGLEKSKSRIIEKLGQHRFQIVRGRTKKKVIEKFKFVQIKDKRFYFSHGIVLLPFSHPSLKKLIE